MDANDDKVRFGALDGKQPDTLFGDLHTPCYIIDEAQLVRNGEILQGVAKRTGCKILLAQKAFSNFNFYPLLANYLDGTEASGLYEAMLGAKKMAGKEVHVFCAGYRNDEIDELVKYADHIVFNSPSQLKKFGFRVKQAGKSVGLRINPQCSTQEGHAIYDPCSEGSRMGTTREQWDSLMTEQLISLLDGLHFHTLCEQNSDDLETTLYAVKEKFGDILPSMKWLNMGGGHHITRCDYDIAKLEKCIGLAKQWWDVEVYLEPGEACALNAGFLATRVLDLIKNGNTNIAILDVSAACHMPDVIEMPYTPPLYGAKADESKKYVYRLGGPTCLSGDVVGDYSFDNELKEGQLLLFGDMAIYTTCKNNTFNGMPLPYIYARKQDGSIELVKKFGYNDFEYRLGE